MPPTAARAHARRQGWRGKATRALPAAGWLAVWFLALVWLAGCGAGASAAAPAGQGTAAGGAAQGAGQGSGAGQGAAQGAPPNTAAPAPGRRAAPASQGAAAAGSSAALTDRGRVFQKELKGSASIRQIDSMEDSFLVIDHDVPSKYAVDFYRIEFGGTDLDDHPLRLVAQIFVPRADDPSTLPIYVFGPGTTGLVDDCAPSKEEPTERSWGDFHSHLLTYATQGYVAIMPDYEGFNDGPRLHHYYVGELQAHVLIDAARAAQRFFDTPIPDQLNQPVQEGQGAAGKPAAAGGQKHNPVFFTGYSHGGYVALAARDFVQKYAPELDVRGVIGYGPRSDPTTLFKEMPSLAPYLLYSYADFYGRDNVAFDRILQPRWARTIEQDVTSLCIDEAPTYYGNDPAQVFTGEFLSALDNNTLGDGFSKLKALLDRNRAGLGGKGIPVLVLQGTEDTVVFPATLKAYMKALCATGAAGMYVPYQGISHVLTRQVSYEDALDWMAGILQGKPLRTTCI